MRGLSRFGRGNLSTWRQIFLYTTFSLPSPASPPIQETSVPPFLISRSTQRTAKMNLRSTRQINAPGSGDSHAPKRRRVEVAESSSPIGRSSLDSHDTKSSPLSSPSSSEAESIIYEAIIVQNGLHSSRHENKPPGKAEPAIWAETRQAICETLWWFRSYQGGIYHKDGACYGALIDADGGDRSYCDAEVIISRIGGGAEKDKDGNLVQVKDQKTDSATIKCLRWNMEQPYPIGIVIGQKHEQCETKLPYRYNVLGWYRVTNIWNERSATRRSAVVGKVRYEKWDLSNTSWWARRDSPDPPAVSERIFGCRASRYDCSVCGTSSPQVYQEALMCLNADCEDFWQAEDGSPIPKKLSFNKAFLQERSTCTPTFVLPDLGSSITASALQAGQVMTGNRGLWKGIVCPDCGNCISRCFWSEWKCDNMNCSFVHSDPMATVPISAAKPVAGPGVFGHPQPFNPACKETKLGAAIKRSFRYIKNYTENSFVAPGGGRLVHLAAFAQTNLGEWGPDSLFRLMQESQLNLQRFRMKQSIGK